MSLAAIPAYFLARMFVAQRSAILVAGMTVLVPSMLVHGRGHDRERVLPGVPAGAALVARSRAVAVARESGTRARRFGLVAFTRIQGIALVGAYLAAILHPRARGRAIEARSYVRRFVPTAVVVGDRSRSRRSFSSRAAKGVRMARRALGHLR